MSDLVTLQRAVSDHYGAAARRAAAGERNSCCSPRGGAPDLQDPITRDLYHHAEVEALPGAALLASLGCGNPAALAELRPGEVVLDLGAGGGIDALLSARRVGPTGFVYGLDMTDDMLALARRNATEAGITNVEFLKGTIEAIPLPDQSVDVIISNCVINLSADKTLVLREAFRVLRPGGRFAVSDVVTRGTLPEPIRRHLGLWASCVGGALDVDEFVRLLTGAGFADAGVEPTREYTIADAEALLAEADPEIRSHAPELAGRVLSAFVRARKPA